MVTQLAVTLSIVEIILAAITVLLSLTYSLPILCIRRFQHHNNIFTLNVCLTTILCSIVYGISFVWPLFGDAYLQSIHRNRWLSNIQTLVGASLLLSFGLVAFHRCCSIVYYQNRFFRTKQWVMVCLASQWILATLISFPVFIHLSPVRLVSIHRPRNRTSLLSTRMQAWSG